MSTISTLSVKIGADAEGLKRGMEEAQKAIGQAFDTNPVKALSSEIGNTTKSINSLIGNVKSLAGVMAGVFGAKELISGIVASGDAAYGLSQTLHLTAKQTGLLSKTLQFTGGDAKVLSSAMLRLQKTYVSNSKEAEKMKGVLAATGVELVDNKGKFLDINDQLANLAKGYALAKAAGQEEAYIMNTLGVRGMSLITTLEQYEEAKESASKVVGVGLNPKEMHDLSGALLELEMQSKQFGTACAMAFVPIAKDLIPPIMNEMQYWAGIIKENKDLIASLTTDGIKLYAAYIAFSKVAVVFSNISTAYKGIVTASQAAAAAQTANEVQTTVAQEIQFKQRLKAVDAFYAKKIKTAQAAAAKIGASDTEAVAKMLADIEKLQAAHAQTVAKVTAEWKAGLAQVAAAHQTMATKGTVANNQVAGAATRAAAAQTTLGNAATVAGEKQRIAAVIATTTVGALNKAVIALKNNWLLVAFACYEAIKAFQEYRDAELEKDLGGATVVRDGGILGIGSKQYAINPMNGLPSERVSKVVGDDGPTGDGLRTITTYEAITDPALAAKVRKMVDEKDMLNGRGKYSTDNKSQFDTSSIEALEKYLKSLEGETGKAGGGEAKTTTQTEPRTYDIESAIGNRVIEEAMAHVGEDWGQSMCANFVTAAVKAANVNADGFGSDLVANLVHQAGSAYKKAGTYAPNPGDLIVWKKDGETDGNPYMHVGVSDGQGGHIASNSSTGITHVTSEMGGDNYYGNGYYVGGYISMAELSGNQTYTKTVGEGDKEVVAMLNKRAEAQKKVNELAAAAADEVLSYKQTEYEKSLAEIEADRIKKLQELKELSNSGAEVGLAQKIVEASANMKKADLVKKHREANDKLVKDSELAWLQAEGKYVEYEDKRYQYALENFDRLSKTKQKEMMLHKDDAEGAVQYEEWKNNELAKLEQEHLDRVKENAEKLRQARLNSTNINDLIEYLDSEEKLGHARLESQKALADEVKNAWKDAYLDMDKIHANLFKQMYSDMSNGIAGFIRGTKSASEAFSDFANSVLDMLAQMIAKAIAFRLLMGITNAITGGTSSNITAPTPGEGLSKTYPGLAAASGGYISGPGTGTSDSIYARLSNGEFVVNAEATKANLPLLEAMNNGLSAFADGGVVTAPTVNSVSGYSINKPGATGNVNIKISLTNKTNTEMKAETTGSHFDGEAWVVGVVLNAVATNKNGMRSIIKGAATS